MRGAPASAVPLLASRDRARCLKQTSTVLWEKTDCVSAGVVVVKEEKQNKTKRGARG